MTGQSFDAILAPLDRTTFLGSYWNKAFVHVPGHPGKFESLFSWEALNRILEQHRLESPRLRLAQKGRRLDPARYMAADTITHRLNVGALSACLSQGATLVLDDVDELAPAVRDLSDACASVLQARVFANVYGSWRTQQGFDVHWDAQDTLILQIAGRKQWKVFRPTRVHPLEQDIRDAPQPDDGDVVWEGTLNTGDLIYLPRGWWHVGTPLNEPSLHLTVTIVPPRAIEFLHWLADQSRDDEVVRMDVPRLADVDAHTAFASRVTQAFAAAAGGDALSRFLADWDSRRRARPRLRLPDVDSSTRDLTGATRLRLSSAHAVAVTRVDSHDTVQLHAGGYAWACAAQLVPAMRRLSGAESATLDDLCAHVPPDAARSLRAMLTALLMKGVLVDDRT